MGKCLVLQSASAGNAASDMLHLCRRTVLACQSMKSMPKERPSLADMRPMDFM